MIVTPVDHGMDLLKSDLIRSPGLHASDVYSDLFKTLEPARYDYGDKLPNPLLLALGTAWEAHLEKLLLANGIKAERPQEFMSPEGIAYSPDLIIFNGVTRLGEIKLTSMGTRGWPTSVTNELPQKLDKYLVQMKLYAYWLELTHGWLAICSIQQPWNPELRCFDLEWTERELRDNHSMCMNHAHFRGMLNGKSGG